MRTNCQRVQSLGLVASRPEKTATCPVRAP
jgi:hypothetical protein